LIDQGKIPLAKTDWGYSDKPCISGARMVGVDAITPGQRAYVKDRQTNCNERFALLEKTAVERWKGIQELSKTTAGLIGAAYGGPAAGAVAGEAVGGILGKMAPTNDKDVPSKKKAPEKEEGLLDQLGDFLPKQNKTSSLRKERSPRREEGAERGQQQKLERQTNAEGWFWMSKADFGAAIFKVEALRSEAAQ
jgi:hypothetical protein